jgi:hypothetical protein
VCFAHDGVTTLYDARYPRARRVHSCEECGQAIRVRERHEYAVSLWEGMWSAWRTCLACVSLREAVADHERAAGCRGSEIYPPIGMLWESALEVGVVNECDDQGARESEA